MCTSLPCQVSRPRSRARQRGVIMIAVLLIVAIVAGLAIKYTAQYQLGLARAEARWHGAQARSFLEGTEEVAKLLFPTADLDPNIDYIGEPWSNEVPIEDDGVSGVARMEDATAQMNLNDLGGQVDPNKPEGQADRYTAAQRRFIRLLQTFPEFQLSPQQAEMMLEAVVDWQDGDDAESGMGGAEGNYYQGLSDPYLPANAPFKSVDELRLVRGFNELPQLVNRLLPYITVLPANAGLNVNTLAATNPDGETANNLLRSLGSNTSLTPLQDVDAVQFASSRPDTGFANTQDIASAWDKQFAGQPLDTDGLQVKTDYFWLVSTVQLVDQRRSMRSLMKRDQNSLVVIERDDVYEFPQVDRGDKDKKHKAK